MRYLLFVYLLFSACPPKQIIGEKIGTQPNVLILFTDDQRWNTIHAWGNDEIKTPNLDRLAAMGTSFTRAHVLGGNHGAICAFSRAMLLTGRPFWNIPPSFANPTTGECPFPTMPEIFKESGYKTYFTGKWHNQPPELVAGFEEGKNIFLGGMHFPKDGGHFQPQLYDELDKTGAFPKENKRQRSEFSSKLYADATVEFIEKQPHTQPFFIYTAFTSPHDPRTPPPPFDNMYDPDKISLPPNFLAEHPFDMGIRNMRDEALLPYPRTEDAVRKEIALYYGMISEVDAQIGRILDALEAKGVLKNTIIVFAGDNGLAVGQHGLLGKQNLYDHSVRVPLIIAGPEVPKGKTATTLCSIHDIFPTVAELAGIQKPATAKGLSLTPALKFDNISLRNDLLLSYTKTQLAVRTEDDWKLIRTFYKDIIHWQLFNLKTDPFESNNLADDPILFEKFKELNERITRLAIEEEHPLFTPNYNIHYQGFNQPTLVKFKETGLNMGIRYTTDGSEPTLHSKMARGEIEVFEKCILKAQTYYQGKPVSPVVTEEIGVPKKFAKLNLDLNPSEKYAGSGPLTLADDLRGSEDIHDKKWLGFNGKNCIIEINLEEKRNISKIKIGYLSNPNSWIFPPKYVTVISTKNGEHFMTECEWGRTELTASEASTYLGEVELKCDIKNTRRLKIIVENIGVCPDWHEGKGKNAWLFLDEVWVE